MARAEYQDHDCHISGFWRVLGCVFLAVARDEPILNFEPSDPRRSARFETPATAAAPPVGGTYQILQRSVSARTIGESALHPHALANAGIFDGGAFERNLPSG